jgi:hypothetical protein
MTTLIALVAVLCVLVGVAMVLLVRGATRQEMPRQQVVVPFPVALPQTVAPIPPPRPIPTVVLMDEDLPLEFPKVIQVTKAGHRIFDQVGCAWDRAGKDAHGRALYRRALGQGVVRH